VAFGNNSFNTQKINFDSSFSKGFEGLEKKLRSTIDKFDNPYSFSAKDSEYKSRIRFYDRDALWARWRRGYELYTITQSVFGSTATNRAAVGDYRFYCAFQQYPGVFIPARIFTFPSSSTETGEHTVAIRDANSLNFYNFGLPITAVRYLGAAAVMPYSQTGTAITVSYANHGFQPGDNIYLSFLSGTATTATLPIVSKTADTFTCTAAAPATTIGNVSVALSTEFADIRWVEIRAKLRYLPRPALSIVGERFTDRISERDPGVTATYTRINSTVTVTCSAAHGLFTGNKINLDVSTGNVTSGLYTITLTSPTSFTITTIDTGLASGSAIVYRLIEKFNYDDYVGYTVKAVDTVNTEIIFQREDSYGAKTTNGVVGLVTPAHRGFYVSRFLTSEIRYQCTCQDFTRREGYNLYSNNSKDRFPETALTSAKPGTILNKDNSLTDTRENIGVFNDLGYITTNNFYQLPNYDDKSDNCYTALLYYQMRWCKHVYAAFFSMAHDEGNVVIKATGTYKQTNSFDITVTVNNHGVAVGAKVALEFTSGAALTGWYSVGQVLDANTFVIVYAYAQTTSGYCAVKNITEHDYIKTWLFEPSDHPAGDDSDVFYKNFTKENSRVQQNAERLAMLKMGKNWLGTTTSVDFKNQPRSVANYQPTLLTSLLTDNVVRDANGNLSTSGVLQNSTQRLISIVSKVVNLEPTLISSTKFGFLNEPLINYATDYLFGLIVCGAYLNGVPLAAVDTISTIDCGTYTPQAIKDVVIDCGEYGV
jgi:hypothetical protein